MDTRHRSETQTLVLLAAASTALDQRPTASNIRFAALSDITDITESLKELADFIQGIHSFLSGIAFISDTIGFGTILLFIAVLVFSAGYSALGMPRGKASFISSLVTADAIWAAWKVSLKAPLSDYLVPMIRSNLIVLCPLVIAAVISRAVPPLGRIIKGMISSLTNKKRTVEAGRAAVLFNEFQEGGARLNRALLDDILASGKTGGPVTLSGETQKSLEELRATLEKIGTASQ